MVKKYNRENCISWWTIPISEPCDICGEKPEVLLQIKKFGSTRMIMLCYECRRKWLRGDLNV